MSENNTKPIILDEKTRFNLTFNNLYAILGMAVILAVTWANISTRLDLLTQKVDFQTQILQEHKVEGEKDTNSIVDSLNDVNKRLVVLETKEGIKNSDESANLK